MVRDRSQLVAEPIGAHWVSALPRTHAGRLSDDTIPQELAQFRFPTHFVNFLKCDKTSLLGPFAVAGPGEGRAGDARPNLLCSRPVREQQDDVARTPAPCFRDLFLAELVTPDIFISAAREGERIKSKNVRP